ncbi:DUF2316 family protein [Rathayibacter sp. YIM 133350]|uniref:DUF2316 family protein n=1 Tax=Rathayibacter sp. YIM 133350 TaxID=3131992 RepID=UPI00307D4699
MTLNAEERARTSNELRANLELSGLTVDEVMADVQFTPHRLERSLSVAEESDPVDVWELRDYLDRVILDAGGRPAPYTVLTAGSRLRARMWFSLRTPPRHAPRVV